MEDAVKTMPLDDLKKLAKIATDFRSRFNELVYNDDSLLAAFNEAVLEQGIKHEAVACDLWLERAFEQINLSGFKGPVYEQATRNWSAASIRLSELYADIADRILPFSEMNEIVPFAARDRKSVHDGFIIVGAPSLADFYF